MTEGDKGRRRSSGSGLLLRAAAVGVPDDVGSWRNNEEARKAYPEGGARRAEDPGLLFVRRVSSAARIKILPGTCGTATIRRESFAGCLAWAEPERMTKKEWKEKRLPARAFSS